MLDLKNILPDCNVEEFRLNTSYRSTKEIMEYANKYLHTEPIVPMVRNGEMVMEKLISDKDELKSFMIQKIAELKSKDL